MNNQSKVFELKDAALQLGPTRDLEPFADGNPIMRRGKNYLALADANGIMIGFSDPTKSGDEAAEETQATTTSWYMQFQDQKTAWLLLNMLPEEFEQVTRNLIVYAGNHDKCFARDSELATRTKQTQRATSEE